MKMHCAYLDIEFGAQQTRFMQMALELAEFSNCRKRHGCVVVVQGIVVGRGWNKHRNNPNVLAPEHILTGSSVHAEIVAVRDAGPLRKAELYVARIGTKGNSLLSRPCERCYSEITKYGVTDIYHT